MPKSSRNILYAAFILSLIIFFLPVSSYTQAKTNSSLFDDARKDLLSYTVYDNKFVKEIVSNADGLAPTDAALIYNEFAPRIADPATSKDYMVRAADIFTLLGRYAEAAEVLNRAALRVSGKRDADLLLRAARLNLVSGDIDSATQSIASILSTSNANPSQMRKARLAGAWLALLDERSDESVTIAQAVYDEIGDQNDTDTAAQKREALFIEWAASDLTQRANLAQKLQADFPDSPEAAIVSGTKKEYSITEAPLPYWYLSGIITNGPEKKIHNAADATVATTAPSADNLGLKAPDTLAVQATPNSTAQPPATTNTAAPTVPSTNSAGTKVTGPATTVTAAPTTSDTVTAKTDNTSANDATIAAFQLGVFSREENSKQLRDDLQQKGFKVRTEKRKSGEKTLIAVLVDTENDAARVRTRLLAAGYEVFPIFN